MLKKFFDLIGLIEDRFLKKFIVLVFLSLLSAPIEILGLGLIIPIFVSLSGGENEILIFLKNYFHFEDKNEIIIFLIFSFLFLNLFRFCFIFYLNNEQLKFRNILTENISSSLFQRYLFLNFNKFKKTNPEVLSKNLIYEVSEIVNNGIYQIILIITDLIVLSSIVFFLMYQNFEVTLILILTLSFLFFTYIFFLKNKIKALSNLKFEMMSHRYSRAYEGLQSYIDIRLNKNEKVFLDTYSKDSYNFFNSTRKLTLTQIMPRYFFELVLIFFGSVLILASYKNNIEVNKLFSLLALYGFASLRLIPLISRLVFSINASSIAHVSFSKLKTDLKIKRNHKFELGSIKKKVDNLNKVQFKKINFFYDKKKILFKKFNVNFEKGNIYKIDGKNGSGKSTLLFILMGLLQPLSGKVLINGKRVKNWNKVIQSDMSFVGSNSFILNKSIVDNICLNNSKLEKQEIISLSLKLGFNEITKKIKKNIIVSGYGSNLSDGQKQQISILRALVSNKKILILDEAINSLDVALKQKLFKYLIHLKKNKIIVFVFHSNNLNKYADKIIKLK